VVHWWRRLLAGAGFSGPLWVTETGYPADPSFQHDPGYERGDASQARWMTTAVPAMLGAGAAMVFVTEHDALSGPFASEGLLHGGDPLTAEPRLVPRPSYYAIQRLAASYTNPDSTGEAAQVR
jgi:hypothetical protein